MSRRLDPFLTRIAQEISPHTDGAKALRVNRGPAIRVTGHAMDIAIDAIEEGVGRVEVQEDVVRRGGAL